MEGCGLILTAKSLWNGNPLVHITLLSQCGLQLLLGTLNCLGRWKMLLKHFRRLCFR
ncbi:hypothetical protein Bca52824_023015 [Brassica carinata]|uniref:Uncharacterized protein n=1 Tax=Brassica carinata TaxID=52824 RepID=A0A8X7VHU5_BRACI|nr:hypothetical protein Bca52824_023015 [Brassica carinata]